MARRRMFLTGSQRAEYEHIHGPLPVDQTDPRFVLVTAEEEQEILSLPNGVPVRPLTQDKGSVAKVQAHFIKAAERADVKTGDGPEDFNENSANVKPDFSVFDVPQVEDGAKRDEPKGKGAPADPEEPVGKTGAWGSKTAGGDSTKKR